ncbi:putative signal peptide-containing protein [Cryptosporidium hominis]
MTEENEKKTFVNNLLIQINIKAWFFWIVYSFLVFIIYFSADYLYIFKNSILGIVEINYLFYSFKSNFLKLKKENHINNVLINIKGLNEYDLEILKGRIFSKSDEYSREIVYNHRKPKFDNENNRILLKATLNGKYLNSDLNEIQNPIESNFESYLESQNIKEEQNTQYLYSIFVSFKNCGKNSSENTINLYNSKVSLFCLNNEITKSDFFIILNDLYDIWFLKFTENEPEMTKYTSLQIYMYNLFDLEINYENLPDFNKSRSFLIFDNFLSQINQLLYIDIKNQNKYITKDSIDFQDNQKTYNRLIQNLNENNYYHFDQNTFKLSIFNHFSKFNDTDHYSFTSKNSDFLFTHSIITNDTNTLLFPTIIWINVIRSFILPKDYKLNFKSRINNVTFKNHIREENQNLFLSDWQISAIQLIHSNYLINHIIFNIDRFFLTLNLYNKFKLPNHILYAIKYMNKIISNIHTISHNYLPTILQNSNNLLFNPEFHNKKTFNTDLVMAVYSPIAIPIMFLIIISMFRIIRHSSMKFE